MSKKEEEIKDLLPNELVDHTFSFLDLKSLASAGKVNKNWRNIANEQIDKRVKENSDEDIKKIINLSQTHIDAVAKLIDMNEINEYKKAWEYLQANAFLATGYVSVKAIEPRIIRDNSITLLHLVAMNSRISQKNKVKLAEDIINRLLLYKADINAVSDAIDSECERRTPLIGAITFGNSVCY